MKFKLVALVLITQIIFLQINIAQQRGVGVRVKKDDGNVEEVTLYKESHALIIGVSDYTNGWKSLPGVKTDVKAVSSSLKENGFNVRELINPTRSQLSAGIDAFINDYGYETGNRLLIYFAGHGHTQKAADGRDLGYIVPTDAPLPSSNERLFRQTALSMNEIDNYARRIEAKHALFIFDSCFSGSLLTKRRSNVPPIITLKTTQPVRQFITAGADDQEVPDVSIFRQQFVEGLKGDADLNNDGYITGSELADFLQEKVGNYTRLSQTPQYGKIFDPLLDKGDFVFVSPKKGISETGSNNANQIENEFWETIKNTNEVENFKLYKEKYPKGIFVNLADLKIRSLSTSPPVGVKKFAQMSETERFNFVSNESERIVQLLGEKSPNTISPEGKVLINSFIQKYLENTKPENEEGCNATDLKWNLNVILNCGKKFSPEITKAFLSKGLPSQMGVYIAMIESEFQPCYQSESGSLGMFQFTFETAEQYLNQTDKLVRGSTHDNPDDRCNYVKAANGASNRLAKQIIPYLKMRFNSTTVDSLLVIAAFNSGEGNLVVNVTKTKTRLKKENVNFWDLLFEKDRLNQQFQVENSSYVPRFLAAAIIGENPQVFGFNVNPLSTTSN